MLERLKARGARLAEVRAEARRERLARRLREAEVRGVAVAPEGERVVLSGRGLGARMALDPELRWLVAESGNER